MRALFHRGNMDVLIKSTDVSQPRYCFPMFIPFLSSEALGTQERMMSRGRTRPDEKHRAHKAFCRRQRVVMPPPTN